MNHPLVRCALALCLVGAMAGFVAGCSEGGGSGSGSPASRGAGAGSTSAPTTSSSASQPGIPDLRVTLISAPLPLAFGDPLALMAAVDGAGSAPYQVGLSATGPGAVTFRPADALASDAELASGGIHELRLDITGADGSRGWATLEVEVNEAPTLTVSASAAAPPTNLRVGLAAQVADDGLPRRNDGVTFLTSVSPILQAKCVACHAGANPAASAAMLLSDPPTQRQDCDALTEDP